jgi:hypothetical protein
MALGISEAVELTKTIGELVKKGITLELQERITELREAVLNAKDEVLGLREANQDLRAKLAAQESWEARAAKYKLVTTVSLAHLYRTIAPPHHFACPHCFEERKLHILQPDISFAGRVVCPKCDNAFSVSVEDDPPSVELEPS